MDLNEKTKIPLFAVLVSLPFVVGFIFWLSTVASDASAAKSETSSIRELVLDIRERIVRIETRLNNKEKN